MKYRKEDYKKNGSVQAEEFSRKEKSERHRIHVIDTNIGHGQRLFCVSSPFRD